MLGLAQKIKFSSGARLRREQILDAAEMPRKIEESKYPINPPWPHVAELERRVGLLEEQNLKLAAIITEVLAIVEQQEKRDGR